jgi:hypothetical protein
MAAYVIVEWSRTSNIGAIEMQPEEVSGATAFQLSAWQIRTVRKIPRTWTIHRMGEMENGSIAGLPRFPFRCRNFARRKGLDIRSSFVPVTCHRSGVVNLVSLNA